MSTAASRIRFPKSAQPASFAPTEVAKAYNFPSDVTGKGYTVGIIELGGGFDESEVHKYLSSIKVDFTGTITSIPVGDGVNKSDGPDGADGEVLLDIEVVAAVAPGADIKVYFGDNTDDGFLDAIKEAIADKVNVISISWGGPENAWDEATMKEYDDVFAEARKAGIVTLVAAGDSGSEDSGGDGKDHVDFPASSPNVIGCGGTRLTVDSSGARKTETVWDDSDTSSATGGGKSTVFTGRTVPDIAGNADPDSGYEILVDGESSVIGGTSAVAPLFAGLMALLSEKVQHPIGEITDVLNFFATNPEVCYDVVDGDNGGFKAGNGKDDVTGFGVPDGAKIVAVLMSGNQVPAPVPVDPTPNPGPEPPVPNPDPTDPDPKPTPAPPVIDTLVVGPFSDHQLARLEKHAKRFGFETPEEYITYWVKYL